MNKIVKLDEGFVGKLERYHYEVEGFKDVINTLLEMHKNDKDASFLKSVVFKQYKQDFDTAFATYSLMKDEVSKFIPSEYNDIAIEWKVDFGTCELTITTNEIK